MRLQYQSTYSILLQLLETRKEPLINKIDEKEQFLKHNHNNSPKHSPRRRNISLTVPNLEFPTNNHVTTIKENQKLSQETITSSTGSQITNVYAQFFDTSRCRRHATDDIPLNPPTTGPNAQLATIYTYSKACKSHPTMHHTTIFGKIIPSYERLSTS
jgi:hypothetical protein